MVPWIFSSEYIAEISPQIHTKPHKLARSDFGSKILLETKENVFLLMRRKVCHNDIREIGMSGIRINR